MSPTPFAATTDQADTITLLEAFGDECGVTVDAGPLDQDATDPCADDWAHGWGTVCLPGDPNPICPACARGWIRWHTGASVSLDVLAIPTTVAVAA